MSAAVLIIIAAIGACLGLSFFFSGSETAIISVNRYRLRSLHEQGDPSAGKLLGLLANTQRLLVMVLIGNNTAGVLAALFFDQLLKRGWPHLAERYALGLIRWSDLLGLLILTPIIIIFAEILPKAIFRAKADQLMPTLRPLIVILLLVMKPIIFIVERLTRIVLSPVSEQRTRAMRHLTRQDVINLITPEEPEEAEEGAEATAEAAPAGHAMAQEAHTEEDRLSETTDERRMIHNIIQLQETRAHEIMTPLVDLVAVQLGRVDIEGFKQIARQSGYSRFPVYREKIVNLIGYIDVFRVLREADPLKTLEDFVEKPHFVPESKHVDDLLQEFLRLRIKNAIVVNEYGGCAGWISREDMLEEIVGELEDELDEPSRAITEAPDGAFIIDGRTEIDALNDVLGTDFSDEEWETLAGLILNEMGRIPQPGDEVRIDGWRAKVLQMNGNRITQIRLTPVKE